jgi:hypothetical protein
MRSALLGLVHVLSRHRDQLTLQNKGDRRHVFIAAVRDFHDATVRCLAIGAEAGQPRLADDDDLFDRAILLALGAGSEQVRIDLLKTWHAVIGTGEGRQRLRFMRKK